MIFLTIRFLNDYLVYIIYKFNNRYDFHFVSRLLEKHNSQLFIMKYILNDCFVFLFILLPIKLIDNSSTIYMYFRRV